MAHCGDLTNKGWSHSGHIALVASYFPLKARSCFSLLVPVSQDYMTTQLWQPSDYVIPRPQLWAKDKLRPPAFRAQFPTIRRLAVKGGHWFLSKASHFLSSIINLSLPECPGRSLFLHALLTLSSCGARILLPRGMWDLSSQTRGTRFPFIARWILNRYTTRKIQKGGF